MFATEISHGRSKHLAVDENFRGCFSRGPFWVLLFWPGVGAPSGTPAIPKTCLPFFLTRPLLERSLVTEFNSYMQRVYGEDAEWYETQLTIQGGVCAVCRKPNPPRGDNEPKKLGVDHNHSTGTNRGLLCDNCNLILGRVEGKNGSPLEKSQDYLLRFIFYLREHTNGVIPFSPIGVEQSEMLPAETEPDSVQ